MMLTLAVRLQHQHAAWRAPAPALSHPLHSLSQARQALRLAECLLLLLLLTPCLLGALHER